MSGFCGWAGLEASPSTAKAALESMARCLTRFDSTEPNCLEGTRYAVASAPLDHRVRLARCDDLVAVVEGDPEFVDADLAAASRKDGAARALIRGYIDRGGRILERVRGAFSFALMRTNGSEVLLAIDRIGGRHPLYYRVVDGGLVFGTTADAIQQHPLGRADLDPQALYNYLYFHVVPGPRSARQDVTRLLPGTCLSLEEGRPRVGPYWTLEYSDAAEKPLNVLEDDFRQILGKSVESAAQDGKTGCFLSGGTDSSTLAGLLCQVTHASAPTFSIGFEAERYDEMKYARIAARHFGTEHHEYYLQPDDVVALIPRVAEIYSEPFGNESAVPAYHCARMAREHGLDLLLGGDGGDELFAGNDRYAKQKVFEAYGRIPSVLRRGLIEPIALGIPGGDALWPLGKARSYIRQANIPMPDRTQTYAYLDRFGATTVLEPDFLRTVDVEEPKRLLRESYHAAHASTMLNRFLAMDLRFTIADSDLPKVTRMCELAGVRVRYPFLSDELTEFAAKLPVRLKMKGLKLRWFFKHALRRFLPDEIVRKTKHGMGMPFGLWLQTHDPLRELVEDALQGMKRRAIVKSAFIDRLMTMHQEENAVYYGVMIWVLVQLELWLRHHADSGSAG